MTVTPFLLLGFRGPDADRQRPSRAAHREGGPRQVLPEMMSCPRSVFSSMSGLGFH